MVDWPSYNELLVRRGQVLLDFDIVDRWDHELIIKSLLSRDSDNKDSLLNFGYNIGYVSNN
jgi:hypothetical protein